MSRPTLGAAVSACWLLGLCFSACHEDGVTSPALSATCEAQPATGSAPLAVRFLLTVSGAAGPTSVAVAYGDGAAGSDPDLPHTYTAAGTYTASFDVTTATQSARCAALVTVGPAAVPTPAPNQPPVPVFKSTPRDAAGTISGPAPLSVRFNMCASWDPDGDQLFFSMDFDGDGNWDSTGTTGAHCRNDHVYAAGTYSRVLMCVHDMLPSYEGLHNDQCKTYTVIAAP